jgi:hypothetical protein
MYHFKAEQRQHRVRHVDRVGCHAGSDKRDRTESAEYRESRVRGRDTGGRGNMIQYPEAKEGHKEGSEMLREDRTDSSYGRITRFYLQAFARLY